MEITRTGGEGHARLKLCGRLDAAWSTHVQDALAECIHAGQHEIELDLSEVAFLSSAGIRVLLLCYRQLHGIRGRLAIIDASSEVRQVIELSGLRALLASADTPPAAAEAVPGPSRLERPDAHYDVHRLDPTARIAVRAIGDPVALLERGALAALVHESFPPTRLAVGVGAFGNQSDACRERLGELLAVAGAALTLPTSGEGKPDWLVCESRLVPDAQLAYGLIGDGAFAHEVRFEACADAGALPLDALVAAALEISAADAIGLALIAEAAQFVGAALRRSPDGRGGGVFGFPAVRDALDFTAEAAHAGTVGIIAGFAARRPPPGLAAHLRPLDRDGAIAAHLHAAVFPYRPIQRGRIALEPTVRALFDGQNVLGLLHLLNDWRPGTGAGQTRLHRGALWCAPLSIATLGGAAA
jgi:anti-anti-sigma factor